MRRWSRPRCSDVALGCIGTHWRGVSASAFLVATQLNRANARAAADSRGLGLGPAAEKSVRRAPYSGRGSRALGTRR
jgi:hypothetical protein